MAIPYNQARIGFEYYRQNKDNVSESADDGLLPEDEGEIDRKAVLTRLADETLALITKQPRTVQFVRDLARLVLKVPARALINRIWREEKWNERERSAINAKLTGYAFVQLVSMPVKFLVAFAALAMVAVSAKKANWLLDKSEGFTSYLDGRAAQLEALKEEGAKKAQTKEEYKAYRAWLYTHDPKKVFENLASPEF